MSRENLNMGMLDSQKDHYPASDQDRLNFENDLAQEKINNLPSDLKLYADICANEFNVKNPQELLMLVTKEARERIINDLPSDLRLEAEKYINTGNALEVLEKGLEKTEQYLRALVSDNLN